MDFMSEHHRRATFIRKTFDFIPYRKESLFMVVPNQMDLRGIKTFFEDNKLLHKYKMIFRKLFSYSNRSSNEVNIYVG